MTRRERIVFYLGLFGVSVFVLLPMVLSAWLFFRLASWYVGKIPERRLPLTEFVSPSHKRFCEWLSGLLNSLGGKMLILTSLLAGGGAILAKSVLGLDLLWGYWLANVGQAVVYLFLYPFLKYSYWEYYLSQAEPAAHLLVGGREEYDKLSETDRKKLTRHVADVLIGINKGTWVVSGGKAQLYNAPAGWLAKFGGPGVLVVQEGHAVVLERSGKISRVVGCGLTFLEPFERVGLVVYLAAGGEHFQVKQVVTKDKVVIDEIDLYVYHKVDQGDKSRRNGMFPFDVKIILEKVWTPKGSDREDKSADLGGAVRAVTDTAVRDVIAQYNLADFITATGDIRQRLKGEFKAAIERVTDAAMGIKIIVVDVGYIKFPADVQQELVEVAKAKAKKERVLTDAEAERQAKITIGEGEREYLRKQGEGKALAAREEGLAKAEGESERVREMLIVLSQLPIDDKSKMNLLRTIFRGDQYREAVRMLMMISRSARGAVPRVAGDGSVDTSPAESI